MKTIRNNKVNYNFKVFILFKEKEKLDKEKNLSGKKSYKKDYDYND
jgi:hypothetical protein